MNQHELKTDEELAVFERAADTGVWITDRQAFAEWFWGSPP